MAFIITGVASSTVFSDAIVPSIGYKDDIIASGGEVTVIGKDGKEYTSTFKTEEKDVVAYERQKNPTTGEWEYKLDNKGNKIETGEKHELTILAGEDPYDHCWVEIIITPYPYRETIESNESYDLINICYDEVIRTPRIEELDKEDIDAAAAAAHCKVEDLFVTEIFDITKYHRGSKETSSPYFNKDHDEGWDEYDGYVEVTLKMKSLQNFVCLLHMNHEGVWDVVDSAKVVMDGKHLYLDIDELSPFAVVVHDEGEGGVHGRDYDNPGTGVISSSYGKKICHMHFFMIMNSIIAFVLANVIRYKNEDDEERINKKFKARYVIIVLSMILDIVFYLLGGCHLCIIALLIELIDIAAITYYTYKSELNEE